MKTKLKLSKLLIGVIAILLMASLLVGCNKANETAQEKAELKESDENKGKIKIKIGTTPGEDIIKKKEEYKPFIEYFEARTGYEAEVFTSTDYASVVEAMRAGEVDIACYGPLSYVLASDVADAEAFAADYREGLGQFYEAYIIVHPDSGINDIEDLKGKNFAFVDPVSTGGYLIPTLELIEHGIDPYVFKIERRRIN